MPESTADFIADTLLAFCNKYGDLISNKRLQKLVYYSQAWYLALYDEPLFGERIEAWVHGPAQPALYGRFKEFRHSPIVLEAAPVESLKVRKHVASVMKAYSGLSAYQLELLTHQETPWKEARGDLLPDVPSHSEITHKSMRDYYRSKIDSNN